MSTRSARASRVSRIAAAACAVALAGLTGCTAASARDSAPPPPVVTVTPSAPAPPPSSPAPPKLDPAWPAGGEAALLVDEAGVRETSGTQTPTPIASVTKVMTAYAFLTARPLAPGADGPTFTISDEEAARYDERVARFESLTTVTAGERFTQRRALEALMVVSANNIAHEIARWVDGGDAAFVARMNTLARRLGMNDTTYTDPSGFTPTTVSTAADQAKLFAAAMRDPAFARIVATRSITEPGADEPRPNGNTLLGTDGVIGGKTGFTTPAGGNLVFAADRMIDGQHRLVIGAVLAQRDGEGVTPALDAARRLIRSVGTPADTA
ncbi:D-alanyl-D-alanine carboxypeptidase family protein [Yinghuangia seranimata]|uniref:D-alanyl-D-alanine carboxypeptidase family protein n=1 Tax=Yinghuangia seranimata TaxID=408067 RepID=UPI00248B50EA|nr:D-alanyl-D-alanine carboxypeptidase [Yinghuangia seranimata]MDI2126036.1 D-alanyl-D-alanine carboxypeptidase [Yinghuangia seranimata]